MSTDITNTPDQPVRARVDVASEIWDRVKIAAIRRKITLPEAVEEALVARLEQQAA